ncbi:MAG: hypothetical protein WBB46_07300, partial [Candidatus Deferrimicrobiaceae bacterium]
CYAPYRGPQAQRGVPRSGLWSEEWESPRSGVRYASGTGSERAKVASVAERNPPRARVLPLEAASPGGLPVGRRTTGANGAWDRPSGAQTGEAVASDPYKARMKSS